MDTVVPVETILKIEDDESPNQSSNCLCSSPTSPPMLISIGIQCNPIDSNSSQQSSPEISNQSLGQNIQQSPPLGEHGTSEPVFMRPWPSPSLLEANMYQNQKLPDYNAKPYSSNFQPLCINDNALLQLDYRTRNKIKTKQRREDPYYRDQERVRQRTVMQLKRQDPCFRAAEREKGRCRMRLKRLDPVFRTQERERQRERMKLKRQDPNFRERERELQKSRIQGKRLDPEYREKERAHDRVRMHLKRNAPLETFLSIGGSSSENFLTGDTITPNLGTTRQPYKNEGQVSKSISLNDLNDSKPIISKICENSTEPLPYRTSRFFNAHNKEAWHSTPERLTKTTLLFNMFRDDINTQNSSSNQNGVFMSKSHGNNELGKKEPSYVSSLAVSQLLPQNSATSIDHSPSMETKE